MKKASEYFEKGRRVFVAMFPKEFADKTRRTRNWMLVATVYRDHATHGTKLGWAVRCEVKSWLRWLPWEGPVAETHEEALAQLKHMLQPSERINPLTCEIVARDWEVRHQWNYSVNVITKTVESVSKKVAEAEQP